MLITHFQFNCLSLLLHHNRETRNVKVSWWNRRVLFTDMNSIKGDETRNNNTKNAPEATEKDTCSNFGETSIFELIFSPTKERMILKKERFHVSATHIYYWKDSYTCSWFSRFFPYKKDFSCLCCKLYFFRVENVLKVEKKGRFLQQGKKKSI